MKRGQTTYVMGVTGRKEEKLNRFWKKQQTARISRGIRNKMIFSERGEYLNYFKKLRLTETRVLEGLTPVAIQIFGDELVLILNYPEPTTCFMIYSKGTATSFKQFFEQLWKIAEP